jgi:hypothetical protein
MHGKLIAALGAACLALASAALAVETRALQLDLSRSDFSSQRHAIHAAIVPGGDYIEISDADRDFVRQSLQRIEQSLAQGVPAQELKPLVDDVNIRLRTAAADSRQVCRSEHVMGSNRPRRVCMTAAAQRRFYQETQSRLAPGANTSTPGAGSN